MCAVHKNWCPDRVHECLLSTSWTVRKIWYHEVTFMCLKRTPHLIFVFHLSLFEPLSSHILTPAGTWRGHLHLLWMRGVCSVHWPRMAAVGLRSTETCSLLCHQAAGKGSAIISSTSCRFCVRLLWTCGISLTTDAYLNWSATYLALLVPPYCLQMAALVFPWTNTQTHTTGPCVACAASLGS